MGAKDYQEICEGEYCQTKMPNAETYDAEYIYWPWGQLIELAAEWVRDNAPAGGQVLDYMCGTGFLLRRIKEMRQDLFVSGCDINREYVRRSLETHGLTNVIEQDALVYSSKAGAIDLIICTAGLHHLNRNHQEMFIAKVAAELRSDGVLLLGEEVIGEYSSELERRLAVLELGRALLEEVIQRRAPRKVLEAAVDVLANDLLERGEYKCSLYQILTIVRKYFTVDDIHKTWPADNSDYGDVLLVCRKN